MIFFLLVTSTQVIRVEAGINNQFKNKKNSLILAKHSPKFAKLGSNEPVLDFTDEL